MKILHRALLLALMLLWSVPNCQAQALGSPSAIANRKLEQDIANANRQLEALEKSWRQRWDDEKEAVKQDRDRAWTIFLSYGAALFSLASIFWGISWWWLNWLKKDLNKRISEIPFADRGVRSQLLSISGNWNETSATLKQLTLRIRLDDIRHQLCVEAIRNANIELATVIRAPSKSRNIEFIGLAERYSIQITNLLHLLSGNQRYVRLAANLFEDDDSMPMFVRKALPQLSAIYGEIDGGLGRVAEELNRKFGATGR